MAAFEVTIDTVRALALALPEAHERPCYGTPAFYVRRGLFARMLEDGASIVVKVELGEREALLETSPETFVVTDHDRNYPMVVVRLAAVAYDELRELLVPVSPSRRAPGRHRAQSSRW